MIEAAFVFDKDGNIIHWHLPPGRSAGYIPDSRDLWTVLWENRENLGGVAHTHPWHGRPGPSGTDVTTFSACEGALGALLIWPIVTFDQVQCFAFRGPDPHDYAVVPRFPFLRDEDLDELRRLSGKPQTGLLLDELRKLYENARKETPKRVRTRGPISEEQFLEKIKEDLRQRATSGCRTFCFNTYDGARYWKAVEFAADWLEREGFQAKSCCVDKEPDQSDPDEDNWTEGYQYASLEVRW